MLDTSTRLLRLLSVLQSRQFWTGPDLAERLDITPRTLRRDVDRLRSLGYTIAATAGPGGGYRLGQGTALPPLLLDDDEAVAIAVALRSAVDTFSGVDETGVSALVKLEQLLPARLRRRVGALQAVTVSVASATQPPAVRPDVLTTLASACRDHTLLTLAYKDRAGRASTRAVEPLRLAHTGRRLWYLVAWDRSRDAWRTLRVDRIVGHPKPGAQFVPRSLPADAAQYVADAIAQAPRPHHARFKLAAPAAALAERMIPWLGVLEPLDAVHSVLTTAGDSPDALILHALLLGVDIELLEPATLRPHLARIAKRLAHAANAPITR